METVKYATKEQVEKLLEFAKRRSVRDWAMFTVAYWRGLRASEIGKLTVSSIRMSGNRQPERLFVHRMKSGLSAEYMLSQDEKKALSAWLAVRGMEMGPLFVSRHGKAISYTRVNHLFRRYAELAGWPRDLWHPHVLRHSIAVHLVAKGVDVLHVKDWLGHRNIQNTMIYAQITNPVRDTVAEQVYSADNPGIKVNWKKDRKK